MAHLRAHRSLLTLLTLLTPLAATPLVVAPLRAQRPAPPRDWTIDTSGTTVTATRKGGMMSTTTTATLVGPWRLAGADPVRFLEEASATDAARIGTIDPSPDNDTRADETIAGRRVLSRAWVVRDARGTVRWVAYQLVVPVAPEERAWLVRVVFADAITMLRVRRQGFDALRPYALDPPRALAALALLPAPLPRAAGGAAPPVLGDAAAGTASGADAPAPRGARGGDARGGGASARDATAPARDATAPPFRTDAERRLDARARAMMEFARGEAQRSAVQSPVRPAASAAPATARTTSPASPASRASPVAPAGAIVAPAGWRAMPATEGVLEFMTAPGDSGLAQLLVEPPRALRGRSLTAALRAWLGEGLATRLEIALEAEGLFGTGRTVHGQPAAWFEGDPDFRDSRDEMGVVAIAIGHADGTFTPILLLARGDLQRYRLRRAVGAWLATQPWRGEGSGPAWSPLTPRAPAAASFTGLFWGTQLRNQLNVFGGMDLIADRAYLLLHRSGFAYRGLPPGGMVDAPDPRALCAGDDRPACGTWRLAGDTVFTTFAAENGMVTVDTIDFPTARTTREGGFTFDGYNMALAPAPPAGLRLEGTYSYGYASSGPTGSVSGGRSYTFTSDGRYKLTGFTGFTGGGNQASGQGPTVAGVSTRAATTGRYEIDGYRLVLRGDDGTVAVRTLLVPDPKERPVESLFIDDAYYRR